MYSVVNRWVHVVFLTASEIECVSSKCACVQRVFALGARDRERHCVSVYFSPFCRGIILTFVLVGCTQREKVLCHCLVHKTPVLNKLNKTVAENRLQSCLLCVCVCV